MFEQFSERSRRVIFLTRMDAGDRGAAALEPAHLLQAIIREEQGVLPTRLAGAVWSSPPRPPERRFFSAETAAEISLKIERILPPQAKRIPDSADMECSAALNETLASAVALAKELHHDKVEPLHLVAAMLSMEGSALAVILKDVGLSRPTVVAAIQS